ncbi:MAG: OB-fold domain-containing protein [Deltaproteobacteria bacterium]|nr:OB-fold domain-containing protein [Deltaproteobacteria bacterium]
MAAYAKPLPMPDIDSQQFWDGCRARELRAQRCQSCGKFRWPPQAFCPHCYSWEFEWAKLGGTGTVCSFVVVHYVSVPAFQDDVPYIVGHITIDGSDNRVTLISNVIECPWEDVRVGMPVRVVFEDVTPEVTLPKFRPL